MLTIADAKTAWENAAWELHDALNRFGMKRRFEEVQIYDDEYIIDEDILDYWDKACLTGAVYEMLSI